MNASTSGNSLCSSLANRCDMQPLTISFWSGRLFNPRCWCASKIASIDSSFAESMKAQVLTTSTSASSAHEVISIPRCKTLPSMTSASTRFLAQPRLIMPTLTRFRGMLVACLLCFAGEFEAGTAATTDEFMRVRSVDRHVLVVFLQSLSVFCDLNGFRIKNPNRHVLTVKFNRTISRGDPSFERSLSVVAECYPHVSSFERLDGDSILFA